MTPMIYVSLNLLIWLSCCSLKALMFMRMIQWLSLTQKELLRDYHIQYLEKLADVIALMKLCLFALIGKNSISLMISRIYKARLNVVDAKLFLNRNKFKIILRWETAISRKGEYFRLVRENC